jgi:hypothetical protein
VSPPELTLAIVAIAISFVVSASAGLGGSLILVPALALVLGTKEGAALAALLLAGNNVVKLIAYRASIPWRSSIWIVVATVVGAAIGARLLVAAPEDLVTVAVILSLIGALVVERLGLETARRQSAPVLAVGSGLTSGFSGTSGPLKGVAVRALRFDRLHTVGAASLVSFAGDATKTAIYADAALIGPEGLLVAAAAAPLMVAGTLFGRTINRRIGEHGYAVLFWGVTTAYTWRLISGL